LAQAYPDAYVDGFDLDPESVKDAHRNAVDAGVAERVTIAVRDAADPSLTGQYQLVCLLDVLHEMPRPVQVLQTCRGLRAGDGAVLVMDAKVATEFTAPGDEVERFQYATSVLHCLPACLADEPSAGTGTVMRPGVVREYARRAGFSEARQLPVADRFHRLYHLVG
jgi:SAM-dependent methyltransferase